MKRDELKKILPHREPMLLIDEAEKIDDTTATGRYTVTGDEFFLQGHFPGNPVVPGVILCEILAQSTCVLLSGVLTDNRLPLFTGVDNVRFKTPVKPGDTFETECRIVRAKPPFYFEEGRGFVAGNLCVKAEFSFAVTGE